MTESDKQVIIDAVISALRTNSQTINQLTPVVSLSESDYFEVSEGRRISFSALVSLMGNGIGGSELLEFLDPKDAEQLGKRIAESKNI